MKKKLTAVALVVCMLAIMLVGASLAYFSDTDYEQNTFTVGKVDIDLHEDNQEGAKDEDYQAWLKEQVLMPGAKNAIAKNVTVENIDATGNQDAYVWVEVLIPTALDDPDASKNSLHVNTYGMYGVEYAQNKDANGKFYNAELAQLWYDQATTADLKDGYKGTATVEEVEYSVYVKLYKDALEPGETTSPCIYQVYMDPAVEQSAEGYVLPNGETYTGTWDVIVRAYAIQADGFDTVEEAYAAYDGEYPAE